MREQVLGNLPAVVELTDQVFLGDLDIIEIGFTKRRIAADQLYRTGADAEVRHVNQKKTDTLVFRHVKIRPDQAEDPV